MQFNVRHIFFSSLIVFINALCSKKMLLLALQLDNVVVNGYSKNGYFTPFIIVSNFVYYYKISTTKLDGKLWALSKG